MAVPALWLRLILLRRAVERLVPFRSESPLKAVKKRSRHALAPMLRRRIGNVDLVRLLEPERITAADRTAAHDGGVNADVDLVVLGRRTQDAWILR